jgi:hypothetical protein
LEYLLSPPIFLLVHQMALVRRQTVLDKDDLLAPQMPLKILQESDQVSESQLPGRVWKERKKRLPGKIE